MTDVHVSTDLEFAAVDGLSLTLDLYRPDVAGPVPVVLYLHGGGWQVGDKAEGAQSRQARLAGYGIAVASANYRFASQASYPAPVHDAKAAVRWLRAHGGEHGLRTDRVGAWGGSAGAYLASMLGLTAGQPELEGEVGADLGQDSGVQAVVPWFGPSDLFANSRRSWLERQLLAPPFEGPLLGVEQIGDDSRQAAWEASPLRWVSPAAPPFLIAHGDRDRITPASESQALHDALVRAGAQSTYLLLGGAGHEGPEFDRPDHLRLTAAFLDTHLSPA